MGFVAQMRYAKVILIPKKRRATSVFNHALGYMASMFNAKTNRRSFM